jgi:hypothetical protein
VLIQLYGKRWSIEVFFRIMKQGFKVGGRRFETMDRMKRYLGLCTVLSWRVFYLAQVGPRVS